MSEERLTNLPPQEMATLYRQAEEYAQAHPELLDTLALQGLNPVEARSAIMITLLRQRVADLAAQQADAINAVAAAEEQRTATEDSDLWSWNGERPLTDEEVDALVALGTPPVRGQTDGYAAIDQATALIDVQNRALWSTAYQNDLPDSSFAYIEPGGTKDKEGKTAPRSKRHLPYKDKNGKVDAAHLRNALARLNQTHIPAAAKASALRKLRAAAKGVGVKASTKVAA